MFVVIQTGGKQINVSYGQEIFIEKIIGEPQDKVIFDKILMIDQEIGTPFLSGAEVHGKIIKQDKEKKIKVFKYKPKKNSKSMYGHRQPYTKVLISDIMVNGKSIVDKTAPIKPVIADTDLSTTNNHGEAITNITTPTPVVTNSKPVIAKSTTATKNSTIIPEQENKKTVVVESKVTTVFDHKKMTVKVIKEEDKLVSSDVKTDTKTKK